MKALFTALAVLTIGILAIPYAANFSAVEATEPPEDVPAPPDDESIVPSNPSKDVYFGELHIHTAYSFDSYIFGNPVGPDGAYRFAKGEPVSLYGGETKQLKNPLDFVAVTDHAEFLGELQLCTTPGSAAFESEMCQQMRANNMSAFSRLAMSVTARKRVEEVCGANGEDCAAIAGDLWTRTRNNANRHYEPGKFTTLVGYEFSQNTPTAQFSDFTNKTRSDVPGMLHRNVIFRSDHVPEKAFSAYDGNGEELHKWLETNCIDDCQVLTIPHNSNYSWGRFFWSDKNSDGSAWTKDILERRARVEPLVEIFQIKGSSECMAGVGLTDEECGFENTVAACPPGEEDACASADSFVRTALVRGLEVERTLGVNPFKYGFVAATDTHNGNPGGTVEDTYNGHLGQQDFSAGKRMGYSQKIGSGGRREKSGKFAYLMFNPGGLTGAWAERNTRGAIWDALNSRETYGTSGTRIRVRFFGSFDYPSDLHRSKDLVEQAYASGVPMGGDLRAAKGSKAPRFVVWAARDPDSAPLQKIQIIKGWVENGINKSRTFDAVCSDGIKPDTRTGLCADNGARADLASCAYQLDKGAGELTTTWSDPTFDPERRAVYYVRVLENPTCRYSTWDALRLGVAPDDKWSPTVKERAWTSPIWYAPAVH